MSEKEQRNAAPLSHLVKTLQRINAARERGDIEREAEVELMFDRPSTRLAIYGSLAPGEVNHSVIEQVAGKWTEGFVRGSVHMKGWGSHVGFPGMIWIPSSEERLGVKLFTSSQLPDHWERIDRFEGSDYLRILVPVEDRSGVPVVANIYQIRERSS